ncbi:MAG: helix-hairpin-helix domain-containing protein [Patescibacteria group bacterium]|jgi:DNA polymerase/3'-5' exonuclease PolX
MLANNIDQHLSLQFNQVIADKFERKAQIFFADDKKKFRGLAYHKAAKTIRMLDRSLIDIYASGWLVGIQKIDGIGNRIAHEIETEIKKNKKRGSTSS